VYGEGKGSSSESVCLEQEDVATSQDEWSRMTEVIGLNDKWPMLLMVMVWEMKASLRSMVSGGFGYDCAEWSRNAQRTAVETVDT